MDSIVFRWDCSALGSTTRCHRHSQRSLAMRQTGSGQVTHLHAYTLTHLRTLHTCLHTHLHTHLHIHHNSFRFSDCIIQQLLALFTIPTTSFFCFVERKQPRGQIVSIIWAHTRRFFGMLPSLTTISWNWLRICIEKEDDNDFKMINTSKTGTENR